ncbi:conserved hypothetical protein [Candidatus Sulfopaludibacter sp. SbA3]|nr:conserved hypothetical protein [Candidatus Sulfopaludibacter sp. SbA3]
MGLKDSTRTVLLVALAGLRAPLHPQDLTPRAYLITPTGSHAVILSTSFSRGQILIDPTEPIEDAKGVFEVPTLGYYQSFSLLGRSANFTAVLPYAVGNFTGTVAGSDREAYRSGLGDARIRFSVNLNGGPAMHVGEYLKWQEKRLIGASVTLVIPNGQYDPARAINTGANRWGFKPEIGISKRWRRWAVDWYAGAWFFTANHAYYPGNSLRTQSPVGAVENHLGYYLKPRLWMSLDWNFWAGGRSTVNGVEKQDEQRDSRVGGTMSVPFNRHQSVKLSYSQGAYVTIGGAYRTITVGWQYSWISPAR